MLSFIFLLVCKIVHIKPTFVQGESRNQVYLGYAEPPPKVHLYECFLFHECFCYYT